MCLYTLQFALSTRLLGPLTCSSTFWLLIPELLHLDHSPFSYVPQITEYLNAQESAKSARVSSCLGVLEVLSLRGVALWLPLGHTSLKSHVVSPSLTAQPVALWRLPS